MYAVIHTGGKQERVEEGERVAVELLGEPPGAEVTLVPVLVVDGDDVLVTPEQLSGASVTGRIVGHRPGPKVKAMTYKPKTNQRRRWGHRQSYAVVEISSIERPARSTGGRRTGGAAGGSRKTAGSGERARGQRSGRRQDQAGGPDEASGQDG